LDDAQTRLQYYHQVLDRSIAAAQARQRQRGCTTRCGT
jgi:hypothetical protein